MLLVDYDILPVNFSGVPLTLETDDTFLRVLAWRNRDTPDVLPKAMDTQLIARQTQKFETLQLIFEGKNVISKRNLKSIAALEQEISSTPEYRSLCYNPSGDACSKPHSIARLFDGTYGPAFNDTTFSNIPNTLQRAIDNPSIKQQIDFFLGKDCRIEVTHGLAECSITRTMFSFGKPLSNDEVDMDDSMILEEYFRHHLHEKLTDLHNNGYGQMTLYFTSRLLFQIDLEQQVIYDLMFALGSMVFIFFFMVCQTHSLFITFLALGGILTSFLATNMVYRIVFDYKYFGIFHVLSIFIILGIGADDVFVYHDTWRATANSKTISLEHRLSICYRRASVSMLITSLTTMVAFISNAYSPLLAISSFGIFSATLVFINFLTAITFFPSVVLIHHLYFENWKWPCFSACRSKIKPNVAPNGNGIQPAQAPRTNMVVGFFRNYYFQFVTHIYIRWVLIFGYLATITIFVIFAKDLRTDHEAVSCPFSLLGCIAPTVITQRNKHSNVRYSWS